MFIKKGGTREERKEDDEAGLSNGCVVRQRELPLPVMQAGVATAGGASAGALQPRSNADA